MARTARSASELIATLRKAGIEKNREGMARFGIDTSRALGVSMPEIRRIAKTALPSHEVAKQLWQSGLHEARILAGFVEEPNQVTRKQMDEWVADFNSWDLCDQITGNLFDRLSMSDEAIEDWRDDEREFVKRAAFSTIAWRAVHLKTLPDEHFLTYLPMIEKAASDNRNFVKKAVNWALRQIGKRSTTLYKPALELAHRLAASPDKSAAWIGRDAVKELESDKVRMRLG